MKNVLSFVSLKKRPQVRRALGYVQYYYNSILFLFQEKNRAELYWLDSIFLWWLSGSIPTRVVKLQQLDTSNLDGRSCLEFLASFLIPIGKNLKLSPSFPLVHTVHETFVLIRRSINVKVLLHWLVPIPVFLITKRFNGPNTTFRHQLSSLFSSPTTGVFDTFPCSNNSIFSFISLDSCYRPVKTNHPAMI